MLLGRRGELLLSRLAPSNPSDFQMANLGPRCQFVLRKEVAGPSAYLSRALRIPIKSQTEQSVGQAPIRIKIQVTP